LLESGGAGRSRSAQRLNAGETAGEPYAGLSTTRHRGLGGTVNIWNVETSEGQGAKYAPLSPSDLEAWPIDFDDLRPWYAGAQVVCGLGPFAYDADHWVTGDPRPFDMAGTGLESAVYQFGPARRFTRDLVDELRHSEGVTVAPDSTVVGLEFDASGRRCRGVRVAEGDGDVGLVTARAVILACGAVENARLLMAAGLAQRSGWLGRGFMEHARDFSLVLEPHDRRVFADAAFYDLHGAADGTMIGGRLAPTPRALRGHDLPNASITLVPRSRPVPGRGPLAALRRWRMSKAGRYWTGRYGWSAIPEPDRVFETFHLVVNLEHLPARENRIELASSTDRFGTRLPRLHLRWSDAEQERLERFRLLLAEWFKGAGLGRLRITPGHRPDLSAHHHAGTTRMADDPREGVVDPNGRVFDSENLFVSGASVFPSAGFANPTLTIVAMALRLAARVDEALD
jgi:choline dehydrogenase-like flavoprotein